MTRQEANREILRTLYNLVECFPDLRFGQLICNRVFPDYRTRDPFYEESEETWKRLKKGV